MFHWQVHNKIKHSSRKSGASQTVRLSRLSAVGFRHLDFNQLQRVFGRIKIPSSRIRTHSSVHTRYLPLPGPRCYETMLSIASSTASTLLPLPYSPFWTTKRHRARPKPFGGAADAVSSRPRSYIPPLAMPLFFPFFILSLSHFRFVSSCNVSSVLFGLTPFVSPEYLSQICYKSRYKAKSNGQRKGIQ
jgi:hypothetical protein